MIARSSKKWLRHLVEQVFFTQWSFFLNIPTFICLIHRISTCVQANEKFVNNELLFQTLKSMKLHTFGNLKLHVRNFHCQCIHYPFQKCSDLDSSVYTGYAGFFKTLISQVQDYADVVVFFNFDWTLIIGPFDEFSSAPDLVHGAVST